MKSFIDDFKYTWNRPNNGLMRLIIINASVFVTVNLIFVIAKISGSGPFYDKIINLLSISPSINEFITTPWTLFTYFFTHEGFFHVLFNMLVLYWFGMIFDEFLGNRKLVALYIWGGIAGGLAYLVMSNLVEYFSAHAGSGMVGASASVDAIVIGAATLVPEYRISLLLLGPVRIKYIAAVVVFMSIIGLGGGNVGGNVAHLGGALMGFLFILQMRKGHDWSKPVWAVLDWVSNLFKPKPKIHVSYRKNSGKKSKRNNHHSDEPDQAVIDAILDKISESGYEKLTAEEKHILFKASQKKEEN
ncbi:rhomboid family intramembrane serine protease [Rapidithrix thailandica]|uniref:Rhomboid family intramembrane serine protease n=1 Tax=Rapidithrix thailandica TaxID=413964 RepID=A0AAW9SEZ4_9BACT